MVCRLSGAARGSLRILSALVQADRKEARWHPDDDRKPRLPELRCIHGALLPPKKGSESENPAIIRLQNRKQISFSTSMLPAADNIIASNLARTFFNQSPPANSRWMAPQRWSRNRSAELRLIHRLSAADKLRYRNSDHQTTPVKKVLYKTIDPEEVQAHDPCRQEENGDKSAGCVEPARIDGS